MSLDEYPDDPFYQGRNMLFREASLDAAIPVLGEALKKHRYSETVLLPVGRSFFLFPFQDIINLWNLRQGKIPILLQKSAFPSLYYSRFARRNRPAYILFRLFYLGETLTPEELAEVLDKDQIALLMKANLLVQPEDNSVASLIKITPWKDYCFISGVENRTPGEFVFIGSDSLILAYHLLLVLQGRTFSSGLDLCTGSGIQSIMISRFCEQVTCVDINPNSGFYVRANTLLNKDHGTEKITYRTSNFFDNAGGPFDLIVTNPPYVCMPPEKKDAWRCGYGGENWGTEFPLKILSDARRRLTPGGMLKMITISPTVAGKDILVEETRKLLGQEAWSVEFQEVATHCIQESLYEFHKENRISHCTFFIITLQRSDSFRFTYKKVPTLADLLARIRNMQYEAYHALTFRK
ncbi:MAG: class I SAM-dependent methyltransferase [Armatimonadetes bacterium]|nr:class I SAM-dependent methyltransferase [Armatimonadota bacterium]